MSYSPGPRRVLTPSIAVQLDLTRAMLRRERERCGLTQKQAAEQAGMNLSTLQYIEVGRQVPSLDTLLRLLDVYGVTMTFEREENDA